MTEAEALQLAAALLDTARNGGGLVGAFDIQTPPDHAGSWTTFRPVITKE